MVYDYASCDVNMDTLLCLHPRIGIAPGDSSGKEGAKGCERRHREVSEAWPNKKPPLAGTKGGKFGRKKQ